jgi:hypothetical protein
MDGLVWRKSSFSGGHDGGDCVEVAEYRKSSFSDSADSCVEVAGLDDGSRLVRDSKDPDGPVLTFTEREWRAFVCGVHAGEFGEPIPF